MKEREGELNRKKNCFKSSFFSFHLREKSLMYGKLWLSSLGWMDEWMDFSEYCSIIIFRQKCYFSIFSLSLPVCVEYIYLADFDRDERMCVQTVM
jgi:hypothetical protein